MVRRNLYHAVIILGTEIHEVVVDGIHNFSLNVYFVVQVRTSTLARTAYPANDLTTYHFLAQLRPEIAQVCIHRLITEAVVYHNSVAIARLPAHLHHGAISRGIDIRALGSRKVHTLMELAGTINGVDTRTVTRSGLTEVFIGNRLYGRNAAQHFIMILAHLHHIVKGAGLDIELLANHIHFLRGIDNQVGVSHIHQMLIAVGTAVSSLTDGRRNRVGHENHPVQIVITLLYVLQHSHSLVQPAGEDVVLRLQFAVLLSQLLLRRRAEDKQQYDETSRTQPHTDEQTAENAQRPLPHGRINTVVRLRLGIINVVNFAHLRKYFACQCDKSNKNKLSLLPILITKRLNIWLLNSVTNISPQPLQKYIF